MLLGRLPLSTAPTKAKYSLRILVFIGSDSDSTTINQGWNWVTVFNSFVNMANNLGAFYAKIVSLNYSHFVELILTPNAPAPLNMPLAILQLCRCKFSHEETL